MKITGWLVVLLGILVTLHGFALKSTSKLQYSTKKSITIALNPKSEFPIYKGTTTLLSKDSSVIEESKIKSIYPCGDQTDKRILSLAFPALINFAIFPLVAAVNTFWVGRMENSLALAGQSVAIQVFSSIFWIMSFLPSVMTPLVAKAHGAGDKELVKRNIGQAFLIASIMGIVGTILLSVFPDRALDIVLAKGAPARRYAVPYLAMRGRTFAAALLSTVAFSAFRGTLDVLTPLKVTTVSNAINVAMDPLLIYSTGMGVTGAAVASCLAELTAFALYIRTLTQKGLLSIRSVFTLPRTETLLPLLMGGASVQVRALAINAALVAVTRAAQTLDTTGTAAAAHAIALQLFNLGCVASLALSATGSILIPAVRAEELNNNVNNQQQQVSSLTAKQTAGRLLLWGVLVGLGITTLQILCLPIIGIFSPIPEVQAAAKLPVLIGAIMQSLFCVIWTGEGIQQGTGDFPAMAISMLLGTAGMYLSLRSFGHTLPGIWASFGILGIVRLAGTLYHYFVSAPWNMQSNSKLHTVVIE